MSSLSLRIEEAVVDHLLYFRSWIIVARGVYARGALRVVQDYRVVWVFASGSSEIITVLHTRRRALQEEASMGTFGGGS